MKNLSRSGIAFYHCRPLFPKEQMRLVLPSGKAMIIEVTRGRRVKTGCFEIGACFVQQFRSSEGACSPIENLQNAGPDTTPSSPSVSSSSQDAAETVLAATSGSRSK